VQEPDFHTINQGAKALVASIQAGDRKAFEWFYRMEYDNLLHFVNSYLHSPAKAEDLVQETFCALWENHTALDPEKNFRAFVFTMARNRTINELKSRKLFGGANAPAALQEAVLLLEDASADELIHSLDLRDLLRHSLATMPAKAREYFSLSRSEGLRNKEIASRSGVSVKTVEYHIHVALSHLKKKMGLPV